VFEGQGIEVPVVVEESGIETHIYLEGQGVEFPEKLGEKVVKSRKELGA